MRHRVINSVENARYYPTAKLRIVTAASLFDGHDASINIMRRLIQQRGVEIIHLGHNQSAQNVAKAAIEEDAHAVAVSSYQGGHNEYFKYLRELLDDQGASDVRIFGGGGGVITSEEVEELEQGGITKIYTPRDGQEMTLEGIIDHLLKETDYEIVSWEDRDKDGRAGFARAISLLENEVISFEEITKKFSYLSQNASEHIPILGLTGTGGAGKSSLLDEVLQRFIEDNPDLEIAVFCIDPTKSKTSGALLGDRIRLNSAGSNQLFTRSLATRDSENEISQVANQAVRLAQMFGYGLVVLETSGIGQGDSQIRELSDLAVYVMTAEFGAATQLEKIDMLDHADLIAINKYERILSEDALQEVNRYLRRARPNFSDDEPIVFGTVGNYFNDDGVNGLYKRLVEKLNLMSPNAQDQFSCNSDRPVTVKSTNRLSLIPHDRQHYLSEIARSVRDRHEYVDKQCDLAAKLASIQTALGLIEDNSELAALLTVKKEELSEELDTDLKDDLNHWPELAQKYKDRKFSYRVRDKEVTVPTVFTTLSGLDLPIVAIPQTTNDGELAYFLLNENLPGRYPYTNGIYYFERTDEEPRRQFAGEGGPERTNRRFHLLCREDAVHRLSTAFDSVTLYGSDPAERPDIYGKIGESGVSIASLDDMKDLFKGFDLCAPTTSVSMTINGPAAVILAMFFNTAVDQQRERFIEENQRKPNDKEDGEIFDRTLNVVRGTVQADILKEDQAQNTCIFSTPFSLKLMGDIQEYFIDKKIRNYYSVSISGYHMAEAGANPITQLAFTLANAFTYVEYYRSRGMHIDDFAPNLSFFFSNGLDAEYTVLGRVARRIWAIAMRNVYGGNERSQKLKYHIQTSGRSLHAQEIEFNDIRTTLQALTALYDHCNSLHTNAYDEALTTPTNESVRRAVAIQKIINLEFGMRKCSNAVQGAYFIEQLTKDVEEAVLKELDRLSSRGGVLGAMEAGYQRRKIQNESLHYEQQKDSGEQPVVGVNTFLNPDADKTAGHLVNSLTRASYEEKDQQISRVKTFKKTNFEDKEKALRSLRKTALKNNNIFSELMETVRHATLGEICETLYQVGGKYRRSM